MLPQETNQPSYTLSKTLELFRAHWFWIWGFARFAMPVCYIYFIIILSTPQWILYYCLVVVCCLKQQVCVGIVWGIRLPFALELSTNRILWAGEVPAKRWNIVCVFSLTYEGFILFARELQSLHSLRSEIFQLATSSENLELTLNWAQGSLKVFKLFSDSINLAWSCWIPDKIQSTCHLHLSWAQAEYYEQIRFQPIE